MNNIVFGRNRVRQRSANIALGESDFEKIIVNKKLYVDKTYLIVDLIDYGWSTACITRPRRFGKSLNISMLKYFFEDLRDEKGNRLDSKADLFKGLYVESTELFDEHQGKYPVICLNFSNSQGDTWEECLLSIKRSISSEITRHEYAFQDSNYLGDFKRFTDITDKEKSLWTMSLKILSEALYKYHSSQCVVLIDEYDAILNQAYDKGYGNKAREFTKSLLQAVSKDNPSVKMSVVTGCLPLTENSVFTGFNHVVSCDVTNSLLNDCCGLTEDEVIQLLTKYSLEDYLETVREWYSGYNIGGKIIYNSWEIFNFIEKKINNSSVALKSYWATSSENLVLKKFISNLDTFPIRTLIDLMINGESVTQEIKLNVSYEDLTDNKDYIWTLLLLTGFLTATETDDEDMYKLFIPNKSVLSCFNSMIAKAVNIRGSQIDFAVTLDNCFTKNDTKGIEDCINLFLLEYASYHDRVSENSYHMLILGILSALNSKYKIYSNKEVGYGRCDIILETRSNNSNNVIILEFKYQDVNDEDLTKLAEKGYKQISEQGYDKLYSLNNKDMHCFGIAFNKKICTVVNSLS